MSIGSVGLAGFGAGALKGFETMRRYDQEDKRMKMAEETHGLNVEGKRQSIDQSNQLFPEKLEGVQLGNQGKQQAIDYNYQANPLKIQALDMGNQAKQQTLDYNEQALPMKLNSLERADTKGERDANFNKLEAAFKETLYRVKNGDISAINDYNMIASEVMGKPVEFTLNPSETPGMARVRSVAASKDDLGEDTAYGDITRSFFENGSPERIMKALDKKPVKGIKADKALIVDPYEGTVIYDGRSGSGGSNGSGGSSGSGIGYNDKTLNFYAKQSADFWGKYNAEGVFSIPDEAREQRVLAQQRMNELEQIGGLSPQAAARYGNLSVIPELSDKDAKQMATEQLSGKTRGAFFGPNQIEVIKLAEKLQEDSREAHKIYSSLTNGGLDKKLMQGGRQAGPKPIRTKQEYDQLPSGTVYIAPDNTTRTKP